MYWFVYTAALINLIVIWKMTKRLTRREIYATWFLLVAINLSIDLIMNFYFKLYQLNGAGIQLRVHLMEWLLGPSYGIIYLNFMPQKQSRFVWYLLAWVAYSVVFEAITVHYKFLNYTGWKLWYSGVFYLLIFVYLRWHIRFLRKET